MGYKEKARELGTVKKILEWVRNEIKYQLRPFVSTERTFKKREGMCWSKTDLAVKMCRVIGLKPSETLYIRAAIEGIVGRLDFPPLHCHPRIKKKNYEISIDEEAIECYILPPNNWKNIDIKAYEKIPLWARILLFFYPLIIPAARKIDLYIRFRRFLCRLKE